MKGSIEVSIDDFDLVKTELKAQPTHEIGKGFRTFLERSNEYKQKFLQKEINTVFDGYSYLGQSDSLNQYDTDLLHSFVLSDFSSSEIIPKEFHKFLTKEWSPLKSLVSELELEVISQLNVEGLEQLYTSKIGHMISCNYYPSAASISKGSVKNRLSSHKDISLFTVLLFGNSEGFSYKNKNDIKTDLGGVDKVVLFPGYLLEVLTEGKIKALDHHVELDKSDDSERFSYAFFSIPKPNEILQLGNIDMLSETYYRQYLSLF